MTIKELSEFTGKTERTVRRWINKASDKMSTLSDKMSNASETNTASDFSIEEVEEILNAGSLSKDAVTILMQNARANQDTGLIPLESKEVANSNELVLTAVENSMKIMTEFMVSIQKQQQEFMSAVMNEIKTIKQLPHQDQLKLGSELLPERVLFRKKVDKLVNIARVDHPTTYNRIYSEMGYVYGVKIKARAKNRGKAPIDILEEDLLLGKAIAIVDHFIQVVESKRGI